jgi:hypothetical protein
MLSPKASIRLKIERIALAARWIAQIAARNCGTKKRFPGREEKTCLGRCTWGTCGDIDMSRLSFLLVGIATIIGLASGASAAPAPPSAGFSEKPGLEHTYLVFFENGKASLTPEARDILRSAVRTAHTMRQAQVRLMVPTGGADGAALARGRARSVKAELIRDGAKPRSIIDASPPEDIAYANADPVIRAWLDRRAVIVVSPVPGAAGGDQAGLSGGNKVAAR